MPITGSSFNGEIERQEFRCLWGVVEPTCEADEKDLRISGTVRLVPNAKSGSYLTIEAIKYIFLRSSVWKLAQQILQEKDPQGLLECPYEIQSRRLMLSVNVNIVVSSHDAGISGGVVWA